MNQTKDTVTAASKADVTNTAETVAVTAPASKSVSHRYLMGAALASGTSTVRHPLESRDLARTRAILTAAGAHMEALPDSTDASGAWRVTGMAGLRFKTWRMLPGEWFEGDYVFSSDAERAQFQETFTAGAAEAPISVMLGQPPVLIEAYEVLAVAEGWDGFVAAPDLPGH